MCNSCSFNDKGRNLEEIQDAMGKEVDMAIDCIELNTIRYDIV